MLAWLCVLPPSAIMNNFKNTNSQSPLKNNEIALLLNCFYYEAEIDHVAEPYGGEDDADWQGCLEGDHCYEAQAHDQRYDREKGQF